MDKSDIQKIKSDILPIMLILLLMLLIEGVTKMCGKKFKSALKERALFRISRNEIKRHSIFHFTVDCRVCLLTDCYIN